MKFIIRNQAQVPNKYVRFAKWKIRKLSEKFSELLYSEIYIKKVANSPELYDITIKMGVPGPDLIVSVKSQEFKHLWTQTSSKIKRQLRNHSSIKR